MIRRLIIALALVILWAAFVTVIWPTKYRAIALSPAAAEEVLAARENRFTGVVEILTVGGWHTLTSRPDTVMARLFAPAGR